MKKIYSFLAAAMISVSVFAASEPTVADLQKAGYDGTDNVVLCINYPNINPVCFDVYAVGSYTTPSWNLDPTTDNKKFAELEDFAGWYVVEVPYAESLYFKPIIASDASGSLSWNYQPGLPAVFTKVAGEDATLNAENGSETSILYPKAGFYIYKINGLKNDNNPCTAVYCKYTLNMYVPDCEWVEPTIAGDWNNWGDTDVPMVAKMDKELEVYYSITVTATVGGEYKVKGGEGWGNSLQKYDEASGEWKNYPESGNLNWPQVVGADTTITWDCSDATMWRWATCEEPIECDSADYTITVVFPECVDATPNIIGSFCGWSGGVAMTATSTPNEYTVTVRALCNDEYKFNDAVLGWDNEVQMWKGTEWKGLDNSKFGEETAITLDYSAGTYCWKACQPSTCDSMDYTITVVFPECSNATPQLVGDFASSDWSVPAALTPTANPNEYTVTVKALCTNVFKFNDAVLGWENEIQVMEGETWKAIDNITFGTEAAINLDYSAETYRWSACAATGMIKVNAEAGVAKKMMINGQMVIVRDGAMFNVLGAEMK